MEELLTQSQVAGLLKISPKSVRRLRRLGKLKAYRQPHQEYFGNRVYFKASEIQRYMDEELIPIDQERAN